MNNNLNNISKINSELKLNLSLRIVITILKNSTLCIAMQSDLMSVFYIALCSYSLSHNLSIRNDFTSEILRCILWKKKLRNCHWASKFFYYANIMLKKQSHEKIKNCYKLRTYNNKSFLYNFFLFFPNWKKKWPWVPLKISIFRVFSDDLWDKMKT